MIPLYENKSDAVQVFDSVNLELPEHLHDHAEILLVISGNISVRIVDKRQELECGDCAVVFPQQIHAYHTPKDSCTRLFIFDGALTGPYLRFLRNNSPSHAFLSAGQLTADGALALDRIYTLFRAGSPVRPEVCLAAVECSFPNAFSLYSAWFQLLFALIWPCLAPVKRKRSADIDLTCQLVQFIMEHFQEPLTLDTLARELHVNKYYISDIFSNRLQISFRRYLNHIRLEYAVEQMKSGNIPLTDVWMEAGFTSQRSFNRIFMEVMGMAPREYKKTEGSPTPVP